MTLSTIRNQKGISLLEVLIAMVFFAMITMSANTFLVSIVRANVMMKNTNQASQVANQVLDNIRAKSYDQITDDNMMIGSKYRCDWTVNEANNMKKVLLTVHWPLGNKDHKVEVSTIIAK